jgi:hypothetical protein
MPEERRHSMRSFIARPSLVLAAVAVLVALTAAAPGHCGGLIFGIQPGQIVQSAYFASDMGSVAPLVGLDLLSVSLGIEDFDASVRLFIPHFGARIYLNPNRSSGNVVPYLEGTFLYAFPSVDLGDESSLEEMVEDVLGFWGFTAVFGAEYFFSDRFSVGGEYGLRYLRDSAELEIEEGDIIEEEIDSEVTVSYNASYVAASLNFHF